MRRVVYELSVRHFCYFPEIILTAFMPPPNAVPNASIQFTTTPPRHTFTSPDIFMTCAFAPKNAPARHTTNRTPSFMRSHARRFTNFATSFTYSERSCPAPVDPIPKVRPEIGSISHHATSLATEIGRGGTITI